MSINFTTLKTRILDNVINSYTMLSIATLYYLYIIRFINETIHNIIVYLVLDNGKDLEVSKMYGSGTIFASLLFIECWI